MVSTCHESFVPKTPGQAATLACLLEVSAPKPGNVHRGADFSDLTFYDFILSAQVIGCVIDEFPSLTFGRLILEIVQRTRRVVGTNTNLGIALLLGPLAVATRNMRTSTESILEMVRASDRQDTECIFEAIRISRPGGLGQTSRFDVNSSDRPDNILEAMELAADQDLIACQFVTGFELVTQQIAPDLIVWSQRTGSMIRGIIATQCACLAEHGDSLVLRKCGPSVNQQLKSRSAIAMAKLKTSWSNFELELAELDFWLRADGNRRNPGTTADLIAAGLFMNLVEGKFVWLQ